ncbi:21 kDa seed protein-like [Diospyros lotus]|uniref:21 kDa seed protein-like n=1 Tax=Diospyros lotus TaxID=55363 RepID=UPI0022583023|nr:21 kDa seed protein-like [Diospyros lotus]XP_052197405.1 21 kDa seed protein-like [Diospyros lotus]
MADNPEPLYDSSGNKVVTGTRYYLLPAFSGDGGGFYTTSPACPGDIYQESSDSSLGQPVIFYGANNSSYDYKVGNVIYESTDLNIHFPSQLCRLLPNAWIVGPYDSTVGAWIITASGRIGLPGPIWFKFEKFGDNVYVLLFDPSACEFCQDIPKSYVGIISEFDRRPALNNSSPLRLKIVKASDALQVQEARLNKAMIASVV